MSDTNDQKSTAQQKQQVQADVQTNWGASPAAAPSPQPLGQLDQNVPAAQHDATKSNTFEIRSEQLAGELSDRQMQAILLLLEGKTDCDVAEAIGVTRWTIWRWRTRNAVFIGELHRCRRELFAAASNKTAMLLLRSVNALEKDLNTPDSSIRFRTAKLLVRMAGRGLLPGTLPEPEEPAQVYKQLVQSGIDPSEIETGDNDEPEKSPPAPAEAA